MSTAENFKLSDIDEKFYFKKNLFERIKRQMMDNKNCIGINFVFIVLTIHWYYIRIF